MEFSRQEYWSRLSFPSPGDFPDWEIQPMFLALPADSGGFFTIWATGEVQVILMHTKLGGNWVSITKLGLSSQNSLAKTDI